MQILNENEGRKRQMEHTINKTNESSRQRGILSATLPALFILLMGIIVPAALADDDYEIPFDVANIYFELNNTDGDLGIHALIDGEPWKKLEIEDPKERELLDIRVKSHLRRQGLTELFFESAEPPFDELTPEKFFRRFPEGEYEIEGATLEGDELESTAEVTHVMPAPPAGIYVSETFIDPEEVDCDEGSVPLVEEPVVISWDPVTHSHPTIGRSGEVVDVIRYQLVIEWEDEDENVYVYSVDLPPVDDRMSVTVPEEFTALGDEFKFEILVREVSGNQTAVESCFEIE